MAVSLVVFWFAVVIPWLIVLPFDRRRRFAHWYAYTWANHLLSMNRPGFEIRVANRERIPKDQPCVLVANHESTIDILALFALKRQFRFVAKNTLFRVPFLGWMMAMAGYVAIRRGDATSRNEMFDACLKHLKMGNPVALYPEGTRSDGTKLRPFKRGAFVIAQEAKVPVVPVVISGMAAALPPDAFVFAADTKRWPVVYVLDPIPHDAAADPVALSKIARDRMVEVHARLLEMGVPTDPIDLNAVEGTVSTAPAPAAIKAGPAPA